MTIFRFSFAGRPLRTVAGAFAIVALSFAALTAKAPASAATPAAVDAPQCVTDLAGRTVKVPAAPRRILLGESRLLSAVALLEAARALSEDKQRERAIKILQRLLRDQPNTESAEVARKRLEELTKS